MKNIVVFMVIILIGCIKKDDSIIKVVKVDTSKKENCIFFKDKQSDTIKFLRKIKILENTISDTILLGNTILPSNTTGEFEYTKLKSRNDISLDLRYNNPPTDRICLDSYNGKHSTGSLKFQLEIPI